jgi:hypothetical protein
MNVVAEQIREQGNKRVRDIAREQPAKVVAQSANISPRHVYNLREEIGQPDLSWSSFILLATQDQELADLVLQWLGAEQRARRDNLPEHLNAVIVTCMEVDATGELARRVYEKFFKHHNEAAE